MEPTPELPDLPPSGLDVEAEANRLIENLHIDLAFADLVRMAVSDGVDPREDTSRTVPDPAATTPLGLLRATAGVSAVAGLALCIAGFAVHPALGLLGLFALPVFVLLVVLAVEQTASRVIRRPAREEEVSREARGDVLHAGRSTP